MSKNTITSYQRLSYLGCFFITISLVLKRFFDLSKLSQFIQGFFIGLGIVCIFAGIFQMRKERKKN